MKARQKAHHYSCGDTTAIQRRGQSGQRGQIVVEYLLLLSIAVIVAALITKTMVSTDQTNPGFVLTAWQGIVKIIAADKADDITRGN